MDEDQEKARRRRIAGGREEEEGEKWEVYQGASGEWDGRSATGQLFRFRKHCL